jgi:hypothetical protein
MTTEQQPTAMERIAGTRPSSLCRCGHTRRTPRPPPAPGRGGPRGVHTCRDNRPDARGRGG